MTSKPSPRKKRKLTERDLAVRAARSDVRHDLTAFISEWRLVPRPCSYADETSRLWRVALKAVKEAIR